MKKRNNNESERSVFLSGGSLSIGLTPQLKKIGIGRGDKVKVSLDHNRIIISKKDSWETLIFSFKPDIVSDKVWRKFILTLEKIYGRKRINRKEVGKRLEKIILEFAKKKWYDRPAIILKK